MQQFLRLGSAEERREYVLISRQHRAIPDELLLRKLLGPDTILLTMDRVLHNRARQAGLLSYTCNEQGDLTDNPVAHVPIPPSVPIDTTSELRSDYSHPANRLATALKHGMTEGNLKRYKTRRRRIRSYFGSERGLAKISLTVGRADSRQGAICGFFLAIAGYTGKKGIRASEGYALTTEPDHQNAFCLLHALREIYLLQLETVPLDLYVIPETTHTLASALLLDANRATSCASSQALRSLMGGLAKVDLHRCIKGPFHDAMDAKLRLLARRPCNELVPVEFHAIVVNLGRCVVTSNW